MKNKKITALFMTAALAVTMLAGCGKSDSGSAGTEAPAAESGEEAGAGEAAGSGTEVSGDAVILTYAEVNSADSLDGKVAAFFKEKVEELSGGTVSIDIQASGVLGTENDILDGMITNSGTVDLCRISIFDLNNYGCKKASLMGLPFLWESP